MPKPAKRAAAPKEPELVVYDCEQGSEDWYKARLGKATASEFATIMASGRDGGESKGRSELLRKLAGETMTEEPSENYSNAAMERGKAMEPEILDHYARTKFADLTRVGFVLNPEINAGCSPDALVGADGVVEAKWASPHVMIGILEKGTLPTKYRAQCHGSLWVTRRKWCDLTIYSHPKMPKFVARLERDELYIKEIANEVEKFNWELAKLVERMQAMMRPR